MTALACLYCGDPIDPALDRYYRRVVAWERPGRGVNDRSGSSLVLREPVGEVAACVTCITKLTHGVAVGQGSLL